MYFFDANIWMKQFNPPFRPRSRDTKYLKFFQDFIEHQEKPKVAVTALLLSELVNRLIRDVHYRTFLSRNGINNPNNRTYKQTFRPSNDYKIGYQTILDDIKAFHSVMLQTNDEFGSEVKLKHIMKPHGDLDFNDTYFYFLAKKKNIVVITDDADFNVEGVTVYTLNQNLLS